MSQKTAQQTRLIGERIRALATILLTRHDNVLIHEVTEDLGLDLIVTIIHQDKPGLRQFGVELRGVWDKVSPERANAVLTPSVQRMLRFGPFPFPVALFFYTMEGGGAWYTWSSEPLITTEGGFELQSRGEASCRPLNDEAMDEIISQIDAWYDAFYLRTSKQTPKKRR